MKTEIQELKILYYDMAAAKSVTRDQLKQMLTLIENLQIAQQDVSTMTDAHVSAVLHAQKQIRDACNKVRN